MRRTLFIFALTVVALMTAPAQSSAQETPSTDKYLVGAVPVKNGFVEFEKSYRVPGKSQEQIYELLKAYIQTELVEGPEHLAQSQIVNADSLNHVVVANLEEWLYFKRKAWSTHRTRFFYQIIAMARSEEFRIIMRRIHYLYDEEERPGLAEPYQAEDWITDEEALTKDKTKLTRIAGKFRRFTIDRKDAIFDGAAQAAGAVRKVKKVVEVEE